MSRLASLRARIASLTRRQKIAVSLALTVAVYAAFGFIALPRIARNIALETLHETFARPATVGDVRINPFSLTVDVERFVLPDRDGSDFVKFESLHANFELSSIVHGAFAFREVRLARPFVHVKILEGGELNFGDMLEVVLAEEEAADEVGEIDEAAGPPPVMVALASIEAGRIVFSDLSRPTHFEHEISPLDIEVRDFGTRPDDESPYSFKATTGAGETLEWQGSISAVPLRSKGRLTLTGVRPRTGWLYVQDDVFFEVVDGTVDVGSTYDLDARDGLMLRLDEGEIHVRDFAVADRETGANAMSIAALDVEGIELAYPDQVVHIASVRSSGGRHHALRLEDGRFRIEELTRMRGAAPAPPPSATPSETPPPAALLADSNPPPSALLADSTPPPSALLADSTPPPSPASGAVEESSWSLVIDEIEVTEHRIDFEDRSTDPPIALALAPISVRLSDVRSDPTHPIDAHLEVAIEEGRVVVDGSLRAEPPIADLSIVVDALDLRVFEPYWLPFADVDLASGRFGTAGKLSVAVSPTGEPRIAWSGDSRLDALRLLDRTLRTDLLAWSALELSGLEVDSSGPSLSMERLRLVEPSAHLVIASDGNTNLSYVAVDQPGEGAAPAPSETAPKTRPRVSIGRVEIAGGSATFDDRSVKPRFQTGITRLDGYVTGLSSNKDARARVDFEGRLDGTTPMRIDGEVSPLADETYADLRLAFENFELSPLTPYSGRHIGQTIARGKLFVDVEYVLEGSAIRGENVIRLDQFTLGDRVESEDALKLPIGLAIALLKDRNGEIRIDLPVKGDVDDPEFSFGKLLFGALGNLITKVALSPFAMLGGLGGGDGPTRSIAFERGRAGLAAAEQTKLGALATALADRPALSLELTGAASTGLDRPVLQADALEAELRRARWSELQGRWFGDKPETVDDVVLEPKDRRRLLEARYAVVFGEKPREGVVPMLEGAATADPPGSDEEKAERLTAWLGVVEQRLADTIVIDESALRGLALQRSQTVRDHVIEQGGVAPERIYVLDVALDGDAADEGQGTVLALVAR